MSGQDPQSFAQSFLEYYYSQFSQNRCAVLGMYTDASELNYQNTDYKGIQQIKEKFEGLGFSAIKFNVDGMQANEQNNVMEIMVQGRLLIDEEQIPLNFEHAFLLEKQPCRIIREIFSLK